MSLIQLERISKLGRLGEVLAAERLTLHGFTDVENLNLRRVNYPFADLMASKAGERFLIGVKARNEMRVGGRKLNNSYNLILMPDAMNAALKREGKTPEQITGLLLAEVNEMAIDRGATAAWITLTIRPDAGTYSIYFGTVASLGHRRSVPMTTQACESYICLGKNITDPRVTADLLNT